MKDFELKSNYDVFQKKLDMFSKDIEEDVEDCIQTMLTDMCQEMVEEIRQGYFEWAEDGSGLDELYVNEGLGDDIEFEVNGNTGTLYVGRNTSKLVMDDGRTVNPYMFIQFGWGIQGEQHPMPYATQRKWVYNLNEHKSVWVYWGWWGNGHEEKAFTTGRRGTDFFYSVIKKYRKKWKEIVKDPILLKWYRLFGG